MMHDRYNGKHTCLYSKRWHSACVADVVLRGGLPALIRVHLNFTTLGLIFFSHTDVLFIFNRVWSKPRWTISFIHFVVCLTKVPCTLPKWVLYRVSSSASSFLSFPCGQSVATYDFFIVFSSLFASVFPFNTCFRRHFLRMIVPIQLAYLLFIVCRIFIFSVRYFWFHTFSPTDLHHPSPAPYLETFKVFLIYEELLCFFFCWRI